MKVKLSNKEICNAITTYMALKGYKTGSTIAFEVSYKGVHSAEFNITPQKYTLDAIQEFAIKK